MRNDTIPLRVRMEGGHPVPAEPGECEPHTDAPTGYLAWHAWAERMDKTHVVRQCHGCGLWAIWERKTVAETRQTNTGQQAED
jgi:hypothetical protein